MEETVRALIAGIVAGAAEGAEALRRGGVALTLDGYSVEGKLEGAGPVACVRVDFIAGSEVVGSRVVGEGAPISPLVGVRGDREEVGGA